MSDEEEYTSEEEEEEEEEVKPAPQGKATPQRQMDTEGKSDAAIEFMKQMEKKRAEIDEQLKDYIVEWRVQRQKEEDELVRLREKQVKRKAIRVEQEKKLTMQKKEEEQRRQREVEEKKRKDQEEKMRRLEEVEKKRQALMKAETAQRMTGRNFTISKSSKDVSDDPAAEFKKPKEILEEEKRIALQIRVKPLSIEGCNASVLRGKATDMWDLIIKLETEKYDLEERSKRQDYDLRELKERQQQRLRQRAIRMGLDAEALTGKHPPKVKLASKFERRVDTRTFTDRKDLFLGGFDKEREALLQAEWKDAVAKFEARPKHKLVKWFGERPGKKPGDPETPEEEPKVEDESELLGDLEPPTFEEEEEEEPEVEEEEEEEEEESEEEEEEEEEEE